MAKNFKSKLTPQKTDLAKFNPSNAQMSALANIGAQKAEIISKIINSFTGRIRQDIGTWKLALAAAENAQNPQRYALYTVFKDIQMDDQVITCRGNQKAQVKAEAWKIADAKGAESPEATAMFEKPWFYEFIDYVLDSTHQGFILLESLGFLPSTTGGIEFGGFEEVPRNNVNPERGFVALNIGDEKGILYGDPMFAKTVIAIGKKWNYGLLNSAAPRAIYKKNAEAAWAEYCEIFGMPLRVGKVASRNTKDIDSMEYFLQNMGTAAYAVIGNDDNIDIKETGKGDAFNVYDKMMLRQDRAIAKIFLGQTMTTDNGSSRSQAEVHERVSENRMKELKLLVAFTINLKLLPFLAANGMPVDGLTFQWETASDITETDIKMDEFLVTNFEFDDLEYFVNKYRVPINKLRAKQDVQVTKGADVKKPAKLNQVQALNFALDLLYGEEHIH